MPFVARCISSDEVLNLKRKIHALKRTLLQQEPSLDIFLKADDPYSYLLIQALETFVPRFSITVKYHVFLSIDEDMYPKLDMWRDYSKYDAYHLSSLYGFKFPDNNEMPNHNLEAIKNIALTLVEIENDADFLTRANKLLTEYWLSSNKKTHSIKDVKKSNLQLIANQSLLAKKGHYLGAMISFEGEWYWGVDRLDHLEERLIELGFANDDNETIQFNQTYLNFCRQPFETLAPKE